MVLVPVRGCILWSHPCFGALILWTCVEASASGVGCSLPPEPINLNLEAAEAAPTLPRKHVCEPSRQANHPRPPRHPSAEGRTPAERLWTERVELWVLGLSMGVGVSWALQIKTRVSCARPFKQTSKSLNKSFVFTRFESLGGSEMLTAFGVRLHDVKQLKHIPQSKSVLP